MNFDMPVKRKSTQSYNARYKRARRFGLTTRGTSAVMSRRVRRVAPKAINMVVNRVNNLYRMIETKEIGRKSDVNIGLPHNNVYLVSGPGGVVNPFVSTQAAGDPMDAPAGNRIGDQITVRGVMIRGFFENALQRPKVYYRVMLVKCAKGDTIDRSTLFKNDSNNKMIDQVNTERFTILAQKTFTISATNYNASTVSGTGVPYSSPNLAGDYPSGIATKTFKMWIPGVKFGRGGNMQYENGSGSQIKFYDYRIAILAYDWYGTPQDANNVGKINEMYTKVYFKDA